VYLPDVMQPLLQSGRRVFCIVHENDLPELEQMSPDKLVILDRRPTLTFRLNALLGSRQQSNLPHVLLVSNQTPSEQPSQAGRR